MDLKESNTLQNLKDAFAGESQANRRYLYFAAKADVEGENDVSAVFRSTAEGETGHGEVSRSPRDELASDQYELLHVESHVHRMTHDLSHDTRPRAAQGQVTEEAAPGQTGHFRKHSRSHRPGEVVEPANRDDDDI